MGKRDVGEADRIYAIYTLEAGKISARASGVRKNNAKLAGSLETATLAEIFLAKTRGMGKITGVVPLNYFYGIRENLEAVTKIFHAFSFFNKIIFEQEKDSVVFDLLQKYLETMEEISFDAKNENKLDILTCGFLFKLMAKSGYKLETGKCAGCGKKLQPIGNFFSAEKGGILCENCKNIREKKINISGESIKLLRIFFKNKLENLAKLKVSEKDIKNLQIVAQETVNWI